NAFAPFIDGALLVNGATLVPTGQTWQGNTLPGGAGPTGNGNLWDIKSFDLSGFVNPGATSLVLNSPVKAGVTNDDCLSLVAGLLVMEVQPKAGVQLSVVDASGKDATQLRVSKFDKAFDEKKAPPQLKPGFADKDDDRFIVRVIDQTVNKPKIEATLT